MDSNVSTAANDSPATTRQPHRYESICLVATTLFALFTAVVPFLRAFYAMEINYNEGWNVYNASALAHGISLYPARTGWTTVNYPAFSFFLIRELSRITHDFLYTGRVLSLLSLLICSVFVAAIVKRISGDSWAGTAAGLFCVALFCARAPGYVGMDDPQLLAQVFFVAGLWLYVSRAPNVWSLVGIALLFVIGGSFKQNAIDFPLAVLLDLFLVSRRRALQFVGWASVFLFLAICLNIFIGGRFFVAQVLTPRSYSLAAALHSFLGFYGPIQIPFAAAIAAVFYASKKSSSRVIVLLFATSLIIGIEFAGGSGVSINAFFSNLVAISMLLGVLMAQLRTKPFSDISPILASGLAVVAFASLVYPMQLAGELNPIAKLRDARASELRLQRETAFLKQQPVPALCESLLRCYLAGKPYGYDPFNSTNLIRAGKLNTDELIGRIERREYGAVQLYVPVELMPRPNDHFADQVLDAIKNNYQIGFRETDCTIYLPKANSTRN